MYHSGWLQRGWRGWLDRRIPAARQLELNQRRIFILPSAAGVTFAVTLLVMLLAAINYQNSMAYALTFLLGALFVVAILHTYRNLAGLQLSASNNSAVFSGEQAAFTVQLHSPQRARLAIALGWSADALECLDVPGDGLAECRLSLPASRRGWLRAPRLRVESRYPLGLLVAWSWLDLQQRVLVYPAPLSCTLPPLAAGQQAEELDGRRARAEGVDDFAGLRAYQPGDALQRLDWKAYSRGQGLQVRQFQALAGHDWCLDLAVMEGDLESRLSQLCHWVLQLSAQQQPFALRLGGLEIAPGSGAQHREQCLQALALYGKAA